jgi:type II secretory pathway pseudopilin PulG
MEMMVVVAIIVVLAGVGGYYYTKSLDEAKINAARAQCKILGEAAEAYKLKHDDYPQNLAVLTQPESDGSKPYLDPDALRTPFGGQYNYDPTGPRNGGNKPDIWAETRQGQQIGNWPQR